MKRIRLVIISTLIFALAAAPTVAANPKPSKEAQLAAKVKAGIAKLGTGSETRIVVKLRDKTKLAGYISQASDDSFVITDLKTGATTNVPYPEVTQVKGNNLSTGATIAIAVGIAVGLTLLVIWLIVAQID